MSPHPAAYLLSLTNIIPSLIRLFLVDGSLLLFPDHFLPSVPPSIYFMLILTLASACSGHADVVNSLLANGADTSFTLVGHCGATSACITVVYLNSSSLFPPSREVASV